MDKQKVLNPLTGRMIDANGATAKSIKQKKGKVSVLEAAIKRKLTKPPEPPKPAPVPETKTKRTYITKKKKEEASKVLQGAVKRALAKKPEPPKPAPKKFGFEDLDEDVKRIISGNVKQNKSRKEMNKDLKIFL